MTVEIMLGCHSNIARRIVVRNTVIIEDEKELTYNMVTMTQAFGWIGKEKEKKERKKKTQEATRRGKKKYLVVALSDTQLLV